MKNKISIIGHFGVNKSLINGQTIKTKNLYNMLLSSYGERDISVVDTHNRIRFFLLMPFILFNTLRRSKNVFILPAHNGVKTIIPCLVFLNLFFKRTIHYNVIGGWLPNLLEKNKKLLKRIKNINHVYVETKTLFHKLEQLGLENVEIVPNSKLITFSKIKTSFVKPFRLCTFSRINKLKGIEDAVDAVNEINTRNKKIICTLDIYGKIDYGEEQWFENLKNKFGKTIRYCGFIDSVEANTMLKNYYILLFPTHYYTEGVPGTIIDGYASGVPVIAAKWESFSDVIEEGITGYGYKFGDYQSFLSVLTEVCLNPHMVLSIKNNCIEKAKMYSNNYAMSIIQKNIV